MPPNVSTPRHGESARTAAGGRPLIAVVAVSFVLKCLLLVPAHHTSPVRDATAYVHAARDLVETGEYGGARPPLYPAALAVAFRLAGIGTTGATRAEYDAPFGPLDAARFMQVVWSTLTVWLVFLLGCELFDRRAALAAAAIFAFYPNFVGYSHLLWSETLFTMLTVASAVLMFRGLRTARYVTCVAGGALLGLAALARDVALYFAPASALWMLVASERPRRQAAGLAASFVLGTILAVAPWTVRNAFEFGRFVPVTSRFGINLLWGTPRPVDEIRKLRDIGPPAERNRIAGERAWEIIRRDPGAWLLTRVRAAPRLWGPGSAVIDHLGGPHGYGAVPRPVGRVVAWSLVVSYLAVMACGIVGMGLAPDWRPTLWVAGMAVLYTVGHAFFAVNPRYRLPLMALVIVWAGFLVSRRPHELRGLLRPARVAAALAGLAVFAFLVAHSGRLAVWLGAYY